MTSAPERGLSKDQIETPALCADLDLLQANIERMAAKCRQHGVAWRPHAKCHRSPIIARKLVDAGAIGATCATLDEAEVLAAAGIHDLLVANQIVGPAKLRRLGRLCRLADVMVCVDHFDQLEPLATAAADAGRPMRVLIELDIGMHRAGVAPGQAALELARQVDARAALELAGVMGYEGHLLTIPDPEEKSRQIHAALDGLVQTAELLRRAGLPCPIVSCGGTGSHMMTLQHKGVTEIQAGGAIFMDAFYRHLCSVDDFQFAVTVLATIVSRPTADRAVIDAGQKAMSQQLHAPVPAGRQDITIEYLSAEHGVLRLDGDARRLRIGQQLEFIPGYIDFTSLLHRRLLVFRAGRLQHVWPIQVHPPAG